MAARAIGSVTLSFGLVAIPVKVYGAIQSRNSVSFHLMTPDGNRVKQQLVDAVTNEVVERDTLLKGYEHSKDSYVTFTKEEIKMLEEVGTKAIEVVQFVPFDSIEPMYLDNTYFLQCDQAAAKPYALFAQALRETGQVGIAQWANRGRGHIVVIRPIGNTLAMQLLHYNSEVRSTDIVTIPQPKQEVKPAEIQLAKQLIAAQAKDAYDPNEFEDEYTNRVTAAIEGKLNGQGIVLPTEAPVAAEPDLMAALQASLNAKAA